MASSQVRVIIPAAGLGTRVGSPPAKELLLDSDGHPLIVWSLKLCQEYGYRPVVIVREAKTALIEFLATYSRQLPMDVAIIKSSAEWPDSVLQAQNFWGMRNILVLPDTRFSPLDALQQVATALDSEQSPQVVASLFDVTQFSTWGVCRVGVSGRLELCEKPTEAPEQLLRQGAKAWGLLGFTRPVGRELFAGLLQSTKSHAWLTLDVAFRRLYLQEFADICR